MFPWESGSTGSEVCPSWASTGQLEQHITGDVAFAAQQYWYLQLPTVTYSVTYLYAALTIAWARTLMGPPE
jgi:hypothetical protein